MMIAAARDVAIIVDLSRLVAPGRQAEPSADGPRLLEVSRFLDRGGEGHCSDRSDARDRHENAAGLASPSAPNELASELGGADAQTAPPTSAAQLGRGRSDR